MQRPGDQLFAGSVLSQYEHIGLSRRYFIDLVQYLAYGIRFAQYRSSVRCIASGRLAFLFELLGFQRVVQGFEQLVVVPGLDDEIIGPFLEGPNGQFHVAVGRDQDYLRIPVFLQYAAEPVQAFVACVQRAFEVHVQEDHVEALFAQQGEQVLRVLFRHHFLYLRFQQHLHGKEHIRLIVDYQYPSVFNCGHTLKC